MSHAVHFQDASGASNLEDAPSLAAALERVEELRNAEGASAIRVFREVPIEVRTYYRVVAVDEAAAGAEPSPGGDTFAPAAEQAVVADAASSPSAAAPSVSYADTYADTVPDAAPATPAPPMQPPSGAMVMSRQPVAVAAEPADGDPGDGVQHDHRRLFTRSS